MTVSALRVFTRQVHFIEDGATVVERAVEVVQGTTGAAWVGAYTATADGSLMLAAAAGEVPFGSPESIDADDPMLVALRAERASVDAPEDSVLAGTLALPFVAGGKVTGLLAVGAPRRPYASDYRETLQAVATNVGLALEVLQVRGLRAQLEEWRERTEWAEQELATLHRLFDRVRSGSHEAQPH
ncbi:MAG TPA: GAF domain-containing protein [Candidatus Elarobacter sp.]|jgi:GAF domain-containing protein|nr:GAF domain-containing protein [Candidatus Elarobacter sp.]